MVTQRSAKPRCAGSIPARASMITKTTATKFKELVKTFSEIDENDRVFIIPTDTIYGISCRLTDKKALQRIKKIKQTGRERKGFVVLVADFSQLKSLGVKIDKNRKLFLESVWPGPVSVVFPEAKGFAFRIPRFQELQKLLLKTGPLISTSANKHGKPPAKSAKSAFLVFKDAVDAYIDVGVLKNPPSTVIKIIR